MPPLYPVWLELVKLSKRLLILLLFGLQEHDSQAIYSDYVYYLFNAKLMKLPKNACQELICSVQAQVGFAPV